MLSPQDGVEQGDGHGEEVAWTYGEKVNTYDIEDDGLDQRSMEARARRQTIT